MDQNDRDNTTYTELVRRAAGMEHVPDAVWELMAKQWAKSHVPGLGRMASPEEIAAFALELASDEYPYMTGAQMVIDVGKTPTPVDVDSRRPEKHGDRCFVSQRRRRENV